MNTAGSTGTARQFWTFLLVGGLAALVNWFSRIMFSAQGLPFEVAVVAAYIFGMATAYLLSRMFVFEKTGRSLAGEIWRFTLVNMVALVVVWVVSVSLERWILPAINWTWRSAEVAHGIGVLSPVVTSYFGHRFFTFGKAKPTVGAGDTTQGGVKP
jgi:putative flippase GtrA